MEIKQRSICPRCEKLVAADGIHTCYDARLVRVEQAAYKMWRNMIVGFKTIPTAYEVKNWIDTTYREESKEISLELVALWIQHWSSKPLDMS